MTDANRLKSAMALIGITQSELASVIGISRNALSNKMNNKTAFNQKEISVISKTLKLSSDDINRIFFAVDVDK